jgi:predicted ATPase
VGRARELALAAAALDGLTSGRAEAAMLVVTGEAGIGKTRVLHEIEAIAARRGFRALRGAATEMEEPQPFDVLVDALDRELGKRGTADLAGLTAEQRGILAEVFPALSGLRGVPTDLVAERYRAHHALRVLLERLATRPLVLLLDDVHWADGASLESIAHLARRPPDSPLLIVLAMRAAQAPPALESVLDAAGRDGRCVRMVLPPLAAAETDGMLDSRLPADVRRALHRESGGNPFYLQELGRSASVSSATSCGATRCASATRSFAAPS